MESQHHCEITAYSNAADHWLNYAITILHNLSNATFGDKTKPCIYAQAWFMRSLIPSFFNPSLNTRGYPLHPKDFHSQNIMITDVDTNPRITTIIDWEFSGPDFSASFVQYPLFIIDNLKWALGHPLQKQNIQDQATFDKLMFKAEGNRNAVSNLPLSSLISNSYPIYLFRQTICHFPLMYGVFYPLLSIYVCGNEEDISGDYYWALMEQGVLRKDAEQFDLEREVWLEAQEVLGDNVELEVVEFKHLVLKHLDKFDKEGIVLKWLASIS